jgi:hypothetical protein
MLLISRDAIKNYLYLAYYTVLRFVVYIIMLLDSYHLEYVKISLEYVSNFSCCKYIDHKQFKCRSVFVFCCCNSVNFTGFA